MGLGSSCLERVVIPYANSPSTNPAAKIVIIPETAIQSEERFRVKPGMTGRVKLGMTGRVKPEMTYSAPMIA